MTEYKGWIIEPVFVYDSGKTDFNVYPPHGEYGTIHPSTTIEAIKEEIDEEENGE